MPRSLIDNKLGLKELVAMGVGGMIGGGIFSVLGLAVIISKNVTPLAFLVASLIAALAGYSYIKLALSFKDDGASFTYLEHAFPKTPNFAGIIGWAVIVGYIGTLALYAYTFGAYSAQILGFENYNLTRLILSLIILLAFMQINLKGVGSSGLVEDLAVYFKILLLTVLIILGWQSVKLSPFETIRGENYYTIFISAPLVFVAFEGFQLITNQVCEADSPSKNVPKAIYISLIITSVLYFLIAIIAICALSIPEIIDTKEYALAKILEPAMGDYGKYFIIVIAVLATSSAINSTMFGASRMIAIMAKKKRLPKLLAKRNNKDIPYVAIISLTVLSAIFCLLNSLETIASFASIIFLLVCFCVSLANLKLVKTTKSNKYLVILTLFLIGASSIMLLVHLAANNLNTLLWVILLFLCVVLFEIVFYRKYSEM